MGIDCQALVQELSQPEEQNQRSYIVHNIQGLGQNHPA